jgi:hypothetical protein
MTDYFLHVDLIVRVSDASAFEDNTGKFLRLHGFQRFDPTFAYKLIIALRSEQAFAYTGYNSYESDNECTKSEGRVKDQEDVFRYVHLWKVPNDADLDLASVMTRSADDALYRAIDSLVVNENQAFVAQGPGTLGAPSNSRGTRFIRTTRQFTSADLTPYLFALGTVAPILSAQQDRSRADGRPDWHSLGAFQNVTGSLNTVTEFWQTHGGGTSLATFDNGLAALGDKLLAKLAPLRTSPKAERRELFQRARYFSGAS